MQSIPDISEAPAHTSPSLGSAKWEDVWVQAWARAAGILDVRLCLSEDFDEGFGVVSFRGCGEKGGGFNFLGPKKRHSQVLCRNTDVSDFLECSCF